MSVCKLCKGLLMCYVIHVVISAEASNSKNTSENVKFPALNTTNKPRDATQRSAHSISASDETDSISKEDPLDKVYKECKGRLPCVERGTVSLIDRIDSVESIPMFEGYVTIEKTSDELPKETVTADSSVALLSRINRFLRSHSIRVHIPKTQGHVPGLLGRLLQERHLDFNLGTLATNEASEGRGRLKRLLLPLILFLELNFAILTPIAIAVVTLLAFKGLWAGLSALMVTGVLGLKALFSGGDSHGSPSTRFSLGFVRPHIVPDIYHSDYLGWSRSVPPPAEHPYRADPYYRGEYAYRGYYPATWDRPAVAAPASAAK